MGPRACPGGAALALHAMTQGPEGEYQLPPAIAARHDEAPNAASTDWPQVVALYEILERMTGNPWSPYTGRSPPPWRTGRTSAWLCAGRLTSD